MRNIFFISFKIKIYYIVPFEKKDLAKSHKMLWDPKIKSWYKIYKYSDIDEIISELDNNFDIKEIIDDDEYLTNDQVKMVLKKHVNLRNSYLLKKKKNDEKNEIMDLEAEFEYLSGQISKDQYENYLSYADL